MIRIFFVFIFFFGIAFVVSQQAMAQRAQTPTDMIADIKKTTSPTPSIIPDQIEILSFPKMSFGESNKYFSDITTIQYQISLLNVLVERQQRNKEIQDALNNVGIVYKEPAPAKTICYELPVNALCAKFYPELYEGLILSSAPVLPRVQEKTFQEIINKRTLPTGPIAQAPKQEKKKAQSTAYLWTDITCLSGVCRAVIVPAKGGARLTVRSGDKVGSDFTVQSIDPQTIRLKNKNGKTVTLQPAPSPAQGGSSSPLLTATAGQVLPSSSPIKELGLEGILDNLDFTEDEIVFVD